jgi:hypothetical protein
MTRKKYRCNLGKKIRQATGLTLPLAMKAAKWIERHDGGALRRSDSHQVEYESECGVEGCCMNNKFLIGPKGRYQFFA